MEYLKALPALISLINEIFGWVKQLQAQQKEASLSKYLDDMATVIREVKNAKTDVEKQAASVKLRDLIGGL